MRLSFIGSEVLAVMVTKDSVFLDVLKYNVFKVDRRFGGTYRQHKVVGLLATCIILFPFLA
jgi:hypothetical protein